MTRAEFKHFLMQIQRPPPSTDEPRPTPDHGEGSYRGSNRLKGRRAVIIGGESGIGRAVALAYASEGADILVAYLNEDEDAYRTQLLIEDVGQKVVLVRGDVESADHCREIIATALDELGGIDILVNNATHYQAPKEIDAISDEEWEMAFRVNVHAMFHLAKAAAPHMKPGSVIINTAPIDLDAADPSVLAHAATKGAIQGFTAGLALRLAKCGIRVNAVAPGPVWTSDVPPNLSQEEVDRFRAQVPLRRAAQPAEFAPVYVMLADPLSSYVSGAVVPVTGGQPAH